LHLKAAKLQRLRHKNANTKNKQWPGFLLPFSPLSKFFNIYSQGNFRAHKKRQK